MQEEIIVENGIKSILQKIFDYYYSYKRTCKTVALGGLLGVNDTWFRYRNSISGVNDLTEFKNSGAYMLYDVTFDLSYKYGSLIVLNCGSQIVQFTFAFHSNALHIRTNWNNEKWTNWQTVSLT